MSKISAENLKKLEVFNNKKVMAYLEEAIELCNPDTVTVITDSEEDRQYILNLSVENGEEKELEMKGHTYHFDGMKDQARDKAHTCYLLSEEVNWGMNVNSVKKSEGVPEVKGFLKDIMVGKEMLVSFFSLGPNDSEFSLRAMQITDSAYVTHSEMILYRNGYQDFINAQDNEDFFFFLHSAGELENNVTKNIDKRRIYIDLEENRVYTVNNQYAGNSVGLKKLAFRLAIQKAQNEGWLAEHMFIMGVHGKEDRVTYFAGAFPSACGKTSTAMIPGQTIVGDDIAYLKKVDGKVKAVNVEKGIFGIIGDVNPQDDPEIYKALTTEGEVIFSNVLINDGKPYWLGMGMETPKTGVNYSGDWFEGKKDANGNEITLAHKNARYTINIKDLKNADPLADSKEGVELSALVYGGRDSDTSVPVCEALDWNHGVFMGSTIESETTAATLGQEGVRVHNPMANLDFVSVPLKKYIESHLSFLDDVDTDLKVYTTNYFLRNKAGKFTNSKLDKKVWMLWAEGRVNGEFGGIETPIGIIPEYEDLKNLFKESMGTDYTMEDYVEQFTVKTDKYLAKMERMKAVFGKIDVPQAFAKELDSAIKRLEDAKAKYGSEIAPSDF